jgi:uncharacterized protein YegJ (DUF2314 family)
MSYFAAGVIALIALNLTSCTVGKTKTPAKGPANMNAKAPDDRFVSLVFLLREPIALDVPKLQAAAERAFKTEFNGKNPEMTVEATERQGLFVVRIPNVFLGVASLTGSYVDKDKRAGTAEALRTFRLKKAIQDHKAWLAVDFVEEHSQCEKAIAYRHIGKLIAELANDDCLALYCVETGQMNSYEPDLLPILRGENPLAALTQPREDRVARVDGDDPRMVAAVAEARRRWPEFVKAFKAKRPLQGFAVKVPFKEDAETEFMWVEVLKIDGEKIEGKLSNEPNTIKKLKLNDKVTVKVADVQDWIYSDGEKMVGGFSAKVLEEAGKK